MSGNWDHLAVRLVAQLCFLSDVLLCPVRYDRRDNMFPGCPSVCPSFHPSRFRGATLRAAPSKSHAFLANFQSRIAMPTWRRWASAILFWPPYNLLSRSCFNLDFIRRFSLMGTTLRAAPSNSYAFSTNYYAYIAMPTWHICAPPILFWFWHFDNLLLRSCLTWIDLHKLNAFLLRSHAAIFPTSNCGRGTSLLQQELVIDASWLDHSMCDMQVCFIGHQVNSIAWQSL